MTISTVLVPPSRSSSPATFSAAADTFLAALPAWATEANATATTVNADAASALASRTAAATSESGAAASAAAASASSSLVNFKGDWSSLTGAHNVPTIVRHSDAYWALTANTSNITTITPGVSASWVPAYVLAVAGVDTPLETPQMQHLGRMAFVDRAWHAPTVEIKSSAYTITSPDAGKILVVTGTTTITLPAASAFYNPSEPFAIGIKAATGATVTVARTGSDTIETVAGNKSMTANTGLWFFPSSAAAWESI